MLKKIFLIMWVNELRASAFPAIVPLDRSKFTHHSQHRNQLN